jgi:hypothetical protein
MLSAHSLAYDDCDNKDGHGIQPRSACGWEAADKHPSPVSTCMINVEPECKIEVPQVLVPAGLVGDDDRRCAVQLAPLISTCRRPKYLSEDGRKISSDKIRSWLRRFLFWLVVHI